MAGLTPGEGFWICFLFSQIFPAHEIGGAQSVRAYQSGQVVGVRWQKYSTPVFLDKVHQPTWEEFFRVIQPDLCRVQLIFAANTDFL